MEKEYKDLWWTMVPTGIQLIEHSKRLLQEGKSIACDNGFGEWTDQYLDAVINAYLEENYMIGFDHLDLDDLPEDWTITDGIADQLGIGYMTQHHISDLKRELPQEGYIWILHHVNEKREAELEKLMKHVKENHTPLMFLFQKTSTAKIKGFENLSISPTRLDLSYFAWTLLLGKFPSALIEYGAALAVEMSNNQPAVCARICQDMQQCIQDPVAYCKEMDEATVISKIHTAQVRIIEPLIEYGRVYLIGKLGSRVEDLLPFKDDYGSELTKPIEVELRSIIYYRFELNLNPEEKELANMLYEARNKISHLELLTFEEIQTIIKESEKWS